MRALALTTVALVCGMAASPALAEGLPLPKAVDIPDTYATALCPDEAAGQLVLDQYLVAGQYFADTTTFLAGLEASGCAYDDGRVGPITIDSVIARKVVQAGETFILYRGTRADGTDVIGLVHEEGNNDHPRNPLEEWIAWNTMDGTITVAEGESGAYRCPTPEAAMGVVDAVAAAGDADAQLAALDVALTRYFCPEAVGDFEINDVLGETTIDLGFEAEEVWTALSATDATGKTLGLLYDASPFR
jgi:hypothetical protein